MMGDFAEALGLGMKAIKNSYIYTGPEKKKTGHILIPRLKNKIYL